MSQLRIITTSGDIQLDWVETDSEQCQRARAQFEEMVNSHSYIAYKFENGRAEYITAFDPRAEKIVMTPIISGG